MSRSGASAPTTARPTSAASSCQKRPERFAPPGAAPMSLAAGLPESFAAVVSVARSSSAWSRR